MCDTDGLTVAELIAELQKQPKDALVVLASDAEGNQYRPLSCINGGFFILGRAVCDYAIKRPDRPHAVCVALWPMD